MKRRLADDGKRCCSAGRWFKSNKLGEVQERGHSDSPGTEPGGFIIFSFLVSWTLLGVSGGSLGALLTSLGSLLVLVGLSRWFWGAFGVSFGLL